MLESLVAVSLGLAVSAVAPSVEAASAMGTPLVIIGILFGGFYISIDSLPIVANWIPYFSFIRWAFEALCINEFQGLEFDCVGLADPRGCILTGDQYLQTLSFDGHTTAYPVFGLGMLLLGYLTLTYLAIDRNRMSFLRLGHTGAKYSAHFASRNIAATTTAAGYTPAAASEEHTSSLDVVSAGEVELNSQQSKGVERSI